MENENLMHNLMRQSASNYMELYKEICYLRYLLSTLVESDEKFKSVINEETFARATLYSVQECAKKVDAKMDEIQGKHEENDQTLL